MTSKGKVLDMDFINSDASKIYDKSRYGNDATITNAVQIEHGYRFKTNAHAAVTATPELKIAKQITLIAWMQTDNTAEQAIIDKCDDGDIPTAGYALRVNASGIANFVTNADEYASAVQVDDGRPHFIAGVLDGTNKFIVIDDVRAVTKAYAVAITDSAANLDIGANIAGEIYLDGNIYFAQVYNYGMTVSQIISIYDATKWRYL